MSAYYNEIDPYAAQWLRNLIKAGHIAPGIVDERDIREVKPDELRKYTQCHFFAGIGVWSLALRRAGWPDDRPVWTGSCPCQPFSAAGGKAGFTDERHLWPHWYHLITQCVPEVIFGEQVASKDGLGWLDLVQTDMEGADYAFGAADLCAAGVGAPHIRQRLWFVAEGMGNTVGAGLEGHTWNENRATGRSEQIRSITETGSFNGLADSESGRERSDGDEIQGKDRGCGLSIGLADTDLSGSGTSERYADRDGSEIKQKRSDVSQSECGGRGVLTDRNRYPTPINGMWRDADWLFCRDGKWRPVEPGTSPLADGITNRVGALKAYGNAINAEAAKEFIGAYLDTKHMG